MAAVSVKSSMVKYLIAVLPEDLKNLARKFDIRI